MKKMKLASWLWRKRKTSLNKLRLIPDKLTNRGGLSRTTGKTEEGTKVETEVKTEEATSKEELE